MKNMMISAVLSLAVAVPAFSQGKVDKRLSESAAVLNTIMTKQQLPKDVFDKAACGMVYPGVKKVGFGIGVTYGKGVIVCRTGVNMKGKWGAPAMYSLDTHSLGAQVGSSSTDYVLLVMSQRGADKVLSGKLKLGADASAVAGPSGASAHGFNDPNVDIVSYSQAKGMFAGASLGSASMDSDTDANKKLYGKDVSVTQLVRDSKQAIPAAAQPLVDVLEKASPKRK
jgi:lipid-binding SYLF domain-containing protein